MIHHQKNIFLCKIIKAVPLGLDTTYQFMIYFTSSFLIRSAWITVKYIGSVTWNIFPFFASFWFENSLPLSVKITGNNCENVSYPRILSNRFMICMTDTNVLESHKNANTRLVLTKCMVNRHLPPIRPITLSIYTTVVSGLSSRNF